MHVLITGANGFVGQALARRIITDGVVAGRRFDRLTLLDLEFPAPVADLRVRQLQGSIADRGMLAKAFEQGPIDLVFHLASIPGGMAERDFDLGRQINLDATQWLLDLLRQQENIPRLVFASTIAVYGAPMPSMVIDDTPMRPCLSYAAQKLMGEILIEDYSRRGWIDGVSLRLPGIVARPPEPSGLLSAFMSDVFWKLKAGEPFECPVSAQAVAWWMSVGRCVDNMVHAAELSADVLKPRRNMALPVLRLTMAEVIDGLCLRFGEDRRALVSYRPDAQLEAVFGSFPPLQARAAEQLGFRHDGDVEGLIEKAMMT